MTPWLAAFVVVLVAGGQATAAEVAGLPLHVTRLNPSTVRLWVGDHVSSTAVVAFATRKGIVVVDTMGSPRVDTTLRGIIARELRRNDFKVLINFHEHGDHVDGNSVLADCDIVAHDLVAEGMRRNQGSRQQMQDWMGTRMREAEAKLAQLSAGSAEAEKLKENLILDRLNLEFHSSGKPPAVPTTTFSDRLTLDMGDTTLELTFIGGMHSASDVAIFVPQHGLLLTGDTMADRWLDETPGCLAAFAARPGVGHDFPGLIANWKRILQPREQIKLLLPGHWNGELSLAGAEARIDYLRTLWEGLQAAVNSGRGLPDVQAEYRLATRSPGLATSPGFSDRNHAMTLQEMWRVAAGQESAAITLHALIEEGAGEAALRQVLAEREKRPGAYYFSEGEINGHGYAFLRENKVDKAIALFQLNLELFPDSWNVYDSLGEALLRAGDAARAAAMYERSLALNPDSSSGKEALARIGAQAGS